MNKFVQCVFLTQSFVVYCKNYEHTEVRHMYLLIPKEERHDEGVPSLVIKAPGQFPFSMTVIRPFMMSSFVILL